jgi:DNA-binding response OmpR family regulator
MKVLSFKDSVDIEALLIGSGIDLSEVEFKQYWDSVEHLDRILKFDPDVLMLDHYMPPTKGLDVLKNLLKSDIKRPQTIVAMSSASMANIAMLKTGADIGIIKFNVSELEIWTHHS